MEVITDCSIRFSFILTVYSGSSPKRLRGCIMGLLAQTYKSYEIVLVVDGPSTDEIDHVIKSFRDSLIIHKLPRNIGPGLARNCGVDIAKGEFVVIIDADDLSRPNRLMRIARLIDVEKVSFDLYCASILESHDGLLIERKSHLPSKKNSLRRIINPINNVSVAVRKNVFKSFGGYPELRYGEDFVLWAKIAMSSCKVYYDDFHAVDVDSSHQFYDRRYKKFIRNEWRLGKALVGIGYFSHYHVILRMAIRFIIVALPRKFKGKLRKVQHQI
jgi:glycosyltransferase involved in cell wall biosynthesis